LSRFSVVVPAYKVQEYLQECLDSVLGQSFADVELIVVDNCSPDGCGTIIDEYAARDRRVVPVHLPHHEGPGPARNAGLAHATGDYLLFLNGDDTLAPGALRAISDRLKETDGPDVLLYDYARAYWSGQTVRNRHALLLTEEGPASFRLCDRPGLLNLLMVAWNKAYRREYVEEQGLRFPPGRHENTPWTCRALMAADSIAVLDRVCVHYRQLRTGGITGTAGRGHFDVFEQYDRVFAFIDDHPELDCWRPVIFRRMVEDFVTLFTRRGHLPQGSRAEFLRRARVRYLRHRPPGARPPRHPAIRLRHALVRLGACRTYRALSVAQRAVRGAQRTARGVLGRLHAGLVRLHYRIQLLLPLKKNHAVFWTYGSAYGQAYGHGDYAGDPAAIESTVRELAPEVQTAWITTPDGLNTLPPATRRLRSGTAAYWTALARSTYLISSGSVPLVKRRGQIVVQAQHGTPLKRMGLDLRDRPAAARDTDIERLLADADTWDYVLSGNRHSTLVWQRAFPAGYTVLEYGSPRNDRLLNATSAEVTRIRESLGIPPGETALLYAPTYRDYRRGRRPPPDLERLLRALGPGSVVLTRAHPAYGGEPLTDERLPGLIDVSDHPSVESLCLAADVLLTDYSSLMFDYALLDRPIVVYADDWEAYEAARGTYFDVRAFPPGAVARTEDELAGIFATGHWRGAHSARLRAAFRARFCAYDDGRAAERVVRRVFLGQEELPPLVPPADRHPPPPPRSTVEAALPPLFTSHLV
jgi:CRISPR system Cascade subunit CasB